MEEAGGGFERRGEVRYRRRGGTRTLRYGDLGGRSADGGRQRVTGGGCVGGRAITEAGTREEEDVRKKVATSRRRGTTDGAAGVGGVGGARSWVGMTII